LSKNHSKLSSPLSHKVHNEHKVNTNETIELSPANFVVSYSVYELKCG